ncbi:hypothetical protein HRI_000394700 [Hibiscus trionum]|uniref:Uncharacterized protein n=1 Tax=Hibiscus trionum TaxID=183268 RepID=A0A9W7GXA1_HIBTR|nr:hypothetical protein HRI_000394700 [Hibiscus trionum]
MEATQGRKEFYSNYMLFNPKKASLFDLIALLFSKNLKNRKFIETDTETEESFYPRPLGDATHWFQKLLEWVPFDGPFKHFGTCVYYNSRYEEKIVEDVPYKNYFSISGFIPMRLNAFYEVIRNYVNSTRLGKPDDVLFLPLHTKKALGFEVPLLAA